MYKIMDNLNNKGDEVGKSSTDLTIGRTCWHLLSHRECLGGIDPLPRLKNITVVVAGR